MTLDWIFLYVYRNYWIAISWKISSFLWCYLIWLWMPIIYRRELYCNTKACILYVLFQGQRETKTVIMIKMRTDQNFSMSKIIKTWTCCCITWEIQILHQHSYCLVPWQEVIFKARLVLLSPYKPDEIRCCLVMQWFIIYLHQQMIPLQSIKIYGTKVIF